VAPEEGRLAGGDVGRGRLASPEVIVAACDEVLGQAHDLVGLHVVITAGGTREPIDPVRFVGNRSSGKQGHALAAEAAARGAKVTLVTTVGLPVPAGADVVRVETAAEMDAAVRDAAAAADVVVMAAAVADFRPAEVAERKLKKQAGVPQIVLEPTVDILAGLGVSKRPGQTLVGFAAETDQVRQNAASKLAAKGTDLIVANDVTAPGAGFEHDTNQVVILDADGTEREVPLADKRAIARAVFSAVLDRRKQS
jgi:phosphopantothenoylcysteine decarboxylase / phosphopantothenate---cysteine ligase